MLTLQYNTRFQSKPAIDINYYPGRHDRHSPVVGRRAHELKGLSARIKEAPILLELEQKIYQAEDSFRYRKLIPGNHLQYADALAKEIYSQSLDCYRAYGYNEDNVAQWASYLPEGSCVQCIDGSAAKWTQTSFEIRDLLHLAVFVVDPAYQLHFIDNDNKYFPGYLAAAHELRHVEEWDLFDRAADRTGCELLTTLQDIIYCDEIYKKIFEIDIQQEVGHDGKSFTLNDQVIHLGKLANFYRELSFDKGSLYNALVSDESLAFLNGRKIEPQIKRVKL